MLTSCSNSFFWSSSCEPFLLFSELVQIHDETFEKTREWFSSMADDMRSKFENHYGDMPATESDYWDLPNGPAWHWWIIAILPLDPQAQVSCIGIVGSIQIWQPWCMHRKDSYEGISHILVLTFSLVDHFNLLRKYTIISVGANNC